MVVEGGGGGGGELPEGDAKKVCQPIFSFHLTLTIPVLGPSFSLCGSSRLLSDEKS